MTGAHLRPHGVCKGAGCVMLLLPQSQWGRFTRAERHDLAVVFASHKARQLCTACHRRAERAGELIDHERVHRTAADRADDYATVRGELPTGASKSARLRAAAARQAGASLPRSQPAHPETVRRALERCGVNP